MVDRPPRRQSQPWQAVILAAGRGASDPMVQHFSIAHKCLLEVDGQPMLARVVNTLRQSACIGSISVVVESRDVIVQALGAEAAADIGFIPAANSAPASVLRAAKEIGAFPLLITTADHPLLTLEMVDHFTRQAQNQRGDFSVALASAETILAAYPQSIRTFFKLGADRVSGCNLFALMSEAGLTLVERWQYLDQIRKKPWRLVAAFGPVALLRFATGRISLQSAFALISQRLKISVRPVLMPFAEAAIDVDKPSDLAQAEAILQQRKRASSPS